MLPMLTFWDVDASVTQSDKAHRKASPNKNSAPSARPTLDRNMIAFEMALAKTAKIRQTAIPIRATTSDIVKDCPDFIVTMTKTGIGSHRNIQKKRKP